MPGGMPVRRRIALGLVLILVTTLVPASFSLYYLTSAVRLMRDVSTADAATLAERMEAVEHLARVAERNTITGFMLALLAIAAIVWYLPHRMVRSLRRMGAILQQAETGNLNVAVAEGGMREVRELAAALNRTLGRLRRFDELKTRRVREEQRLTEALLVAASDGLAVVNPEGKLARVNRSLRRRLGLKDDEISGHTVAEIFGESVAEAVRTVQRDRDARSLGWMNGNARSGGGARGYRIYLWPVQDEAEGPPRILLRLSEDEPTEAGAAR
jgi:PAS domain S-box-containing protein